MSIRAKTWIIAVLVLALWSLPFVAMARQITVREMLDDPKTYFPTCRADPCSLTGPGGIIDVWERYVDKNMALGRGFVVTGWCASACEHAYQRAKRLGARITIEPGSQLVYHKPSAAIWR